MCQAMFWAGLKSAPAMPERSGIVQRLHRDRAQSPVFLNSPLEAQLQWEVDERTLLFTIEWKLV